MTPLARLLARGGQRADDYAAPRQSVTLTIEAAGVTIRGRRAHGAQGTRVFLGDTLEIALNWKTLERFAELDGDAFLESEVDGIARRLEMARP